MKSFQPTIKKVELKSKEGGIVYDEYEIATKKKEEVVDVYYGYDIDNQSYFLIDTELLVWSCKKVQEGKRFVFKKSMLKEEIGLVIGFQHEVYLKRFIGKQEVLKELLLKVINKNSKTKKQEKKFLEKNLATDEWECMVPIPGMCGPMIFEKPNKR